MKVASVAPQHDKLHLFLVYAPVTKPSSGHSKYDRSKEEEMKIGAQFYISQLGVYAFVVFFISI